MVKKKIEPRKEKILEAEISDTITNDYTDYAVYVLKDRAIPNLYTGLKPIQNKLIYTMNSMGLKNSGSFRKCIPIKGQTAFLSIHSADSIYGALVNLAQWFNNYCPLISPKGNFGHITGSGAAADRYTEAKLSQYAEKVLLEDLNKDTVDWVRNYDNTLWEPLWLPARLPNLLVNGALGLGVGFKTSWVTHNPVDVIRALIAYVKNRNISIDELIDIIKAPDFPTGGIINGLDSVRTAYETGIGSVCVRGEYEVSKMGDTNVIRITSIPYGTTTSNIIQRIAIIADQGKINLKNGGLNDLTSENCNIELILKKDEDPTRVMNIIYKETPLETRIPMIHNAIIFDDDNTKKFLNCNLRDIISRFVAFREKTIYRKLKGELRDKTRQVHMIDGVLIISGDIDRAIKAIKKSNGRADAIDKLMAAFKKESLDREQAEYIVDMRLYRLNKLDIGEMRAEKKKLEDRMYELEKFTKSMSNKLIDKIMERQWGEMADTLFKGYKRKTKINKNYTSINDSDMVADVPKKIIISNGYVIKTAVDTDISNLKLDCEPIETSELKYLVFVSKRGKAFVLRTLNIPEDSRGRLARNIMNLNGNDKIVYAGVINAEDCLITVSKDGYIKNTFGSVLLTLSKSGRVLHNISNDSEIIFAGNKVSSDVLVLSDNNKIIRTDIKDVTPTGIGGMGVGIMDNDVKTVVFVKPKDTKIVYQTTKGKKGAVLISDIKKIKRNGHAVGSFLAGSKTDISGIIVK